MNKILKSSLIFLVLFFCFATTKVSAETRTSENGSVAVAENEVINDDLFAGGQSVTIDGTVNGDVFAAGQTVIVNGIINGNLHIGANSAILGGSVKGNSYVGAANISLNSAILGGSLIVGAGNISLDKDSVVSGSILAGSGNISIDSQVKRNVYIRARAATIGANAIIGKNLYHQVGGSGNFNDIQISPETKITGGIYKSTPRLTPVPQVSKSQVASAFTVVDPGIKLISFLGALVIGYLYLKLFRIHLTMSAETISRLFWKSFGTGFLITVAALPAFTVVAITIIGLPLAGVALLLLMIGIYLAKIVVGFALGNWILAKLKWNKLSVFWIMAFGLLIIYILKAIPVIGTLTSLAVLWVGLGALALRTFTRPSLNPKV